MQSAKLSEQLALVATVDPATVANTEVFTDVVDMGVMHQVLAALALGNMASETIDFKAYSCDSDGNNAAAITGRAATQLAANASNNDGKQVLINIRSTDLLASGKQHVKFGVVTGGATGGPATVLVFGQARQGLGSANDLSSVVEIVG
jgi:hypothetical protein